MAGLLVAITLTAQLTNIQEVPTTERLFGIIPQPVYELFDAAKNINIELGGENAVTRRVLEFLPRSTSDIGRGIGTAGEFLDRANTWFEQNVGIRFTQLFRLVGNVFVWILEGIAQLIRIGISYIGE